MISLETAASFVTIYNNNAVSMTLHMIALRSD